MQTSEALSIIRSLADGIDPSSGEVYPADSPYQQPNAVRAFFVAISALERLEQKARREQQLPANAGKPWNGPEDKLLADRFDTGASIRELANWHQRTELAIQARLEKLGKLPPAERSGRFS